VGTTIEETDHYEEVIRPFMPLIITPLFLDHNLKQATALMEITPLGALYPTPKN
jgi:hypothetical protein